MARLAISKDYFPAYARLPRKAQRKADEFLRKFEQDSTAAAIHLEPIKRTLDGQLRSARIGDDYRVILRAPESGDVFLVLWADHHDEAYRWAVTKQMAVHPVTGTLQIFDVSEATEALTTTPEYEVPTWQEAPSVVDAEVERTVDATDLFAKFTDDELFLAGVPRPLFPSVRALGSDGDLDRLLPHLPPEAGEVLTALAAGIGLDEALEEVLGRMPVAAAAPALPPIDITDVPAALERDTTQRQFRIFEAALDLDAALKHPLDVWRVFLHPRQRKLARMHTKGPTRVLGGAGTGKTVVALHRAAYLIREVFTKPDDRLLFTTFTVNLAHDIRAQLAKLLEPDDLARVEVINLDSWASMYLRSRGISVRPAFDADQRPHFDMAYEVYGQDDVSVDFYRAEWRDVVQEQGLRTEEEYALAIRKSRGIPLGRSERRRLWPVFEAYRSNLAGAGLLEPVDILRRATAEIEAANEPPKYQTVVVDEAQDFSADGLRLIRAIAGTERPDDIFLVGDAHQRIYGRPVALSKSGIHVRGRRSQTLRLNYRTTGAICRWSLGILSGTTADDLDDGVADRRGYVSVREGPAPVVHALRSPVEEEKGIVDTVKAYLAAGTPAESICIVARTRGPLRDRFGPALERAGVPVVLLEQEDPRSPNVRMATMHRVKGLEFSVVVLASVTRQDVPLSSAETQSNDALVREQALLKERALLYVASSRARDALHVFYAGEPSPFLSSVPARKPTPRQQAIQTPSRPARGSTHPPPLQAPPNQVASELGDRHALDVVLSTSLVDFSLPARLGNWADREGLRTLRELAARAPSTLLSERNLGRKSVADARSCIENATGRRWEELLDLLVVGASSVPNGPADAALEPGWDGLRKRLTEGQRELLLSEMELPSRLRGYAERENLQTIGDLATRSQAMLIAAPNMGRGTVGELPGIVSAHLAAVAAQLRVDIGLIECFKAAIEPLEPTQRIIASRRSGLGGEPLTLKDLGEMFGVSRERIRQLEAKVCEQIGRQAWTKEARKRVSQVLVEGAVPFSELVRDVWWAGAAEKPAVVGFIAESVLKLDVHVLELSETNWLSPFKAADIEGAWKAVRGAVVHIPLPAPLASFEAALEPMKAQFGAAVAAHFFGELRNDMQFGAGVVGSEEQVLAIGNTRNAEILGILRAASAPMHVDELYRKLGTSHTNFPDEVHYFRRGYVGLRQHFPDFATWKELLVPAAVRLVQENGPERQWSCSEILDELREDHDIPSWLTPYALAELIKDGGPLRYLGRLRVALPTGPEGDSRIYVHEAVEQLLHEAGAPVPKEALLEKLGARVGVSETALQMILNRPQFVRVDEERVGLLARDVPGGPAAIAEVSDHMEALLARRDRGFSEYQAFRELAELSPEHASWSVQLMMSVLRSDGRFRLSRSGAFGLATWESTRVPTRLELVRSALNEAGDRVSVEAVLARIEAHYGARPSRGTLISLAMNVGASVDGEWMTRKSRA